VLKHLVEEGAIYQEEGRWRIKPLQAFSVPQSIKVTIGRRLERLGEESREALALAAVIGQQFSFDLLLQASSLEEERLLAIVEEKLDRYRASLLAGRGAPVEVDFRGLIGLAILDLEALRPAAQVHAVAMIASPVPLFVQYLAVEKNAEASAGKGMQVLMAGLIRSRSSWESATAMTCRSWMESRPATK